MPDTALLALTWRVTRRRLVSSPLAITAGLAFPAFVVWLGLGDSYATAAKFFLFLLPHVFLVAAQDTVRSDVESGALENVLFLGGRFRGYLGAKSLVAAGAAGGYAAVLFALFAADTAHDLETPRQGGVLGELDDRAGSTLDLVRGRIDECLDVTLEERADAHRARLDRGEDRRIAQLGRTELAGRLAEGDDDGVGGRIVRLADPIVGPGNHCVVDDGHGRNRTLAAFECETCLGERLAHEQLVVHGPDDTGPPTRLVLRSRR
jgi:hypothetical protein